MAWLFALVSACSVYDESLLSRRSSIETTGGASNGEGGEGAGTGGSAGNSGSGGSAQGGGAGSSSGGGGGITGGVAGATSGGASGSTNLGGSSSGGVAMGGSPDAGAGGESGEIGTGGTGGTTGGGTTSGGAASGGATSGGTTSGGATSGGATSGGTAGKGGSGSGGSSGNCGGKLSGGICWYVGAVNESCEQVCSPHGSVNGAMAGFVGTANQGGSAAKCQTLVNLFGATVTVFAGSRDDGLGLGCHFYDPEIYWLTSPDFTEDAAEEGARLVCGCNR